MTLRNLCILLIISFTFACQRSGDWHEAIQAPFMQVSEAYVDSLLIQMTNEEKIGQLIILKTSLDEDHTEVELIDWAKTAKLGGMILQNQTVEDYIRLVDQIQTQAAFPLLNGTEEMVVLNNQFLDAEHFPLPATMSAIDSDSIHENLNDLYLRQCKAAGIHFCIAPSVNLVDSTASTFDYQLFEQDREAIIRRSTNTLNKLQHDKILAIGHDYQDYIYMPNDTTGVLDSLLNRYYNLTSNGLSGWKIGNDIYKIDTLDRLFPDFLKDYLFQELDFGGLLISELDETATLAKMLHVGTDMIIVEDNPLPLIDTLMTYVNEGLLPIKKLDAKVKKILMAKTWLGIEAKTPPALEADWLTHLLQYEQYKFMIKDLFHRSVILANNKGLLPFSNTYKRDFRIYQYGNELRHFKDMFRNYARFTARVYDKEEADNSLPVLQHNNVKSATHIVTIDNIDLNLNNHADFIASVNDFGQSARVAIINFGNPFNLKFFDPQVNTIQIFEKNKTTEQFAAQFLFGGRKTNGKLPLALAPHLPYKGTHESRITRLAYGTPEEVGITPEKLVGIDAIARTAIDKEAFPGCQILIAKEGKIIYHKAIGHHTYKEQQEVDTEDLYDLASVTKIAATTLSIMKLYENKQLQLDDRLKDHLPIEESSRIDNKTLTSLLTHRSNIQANMPIAKFLIFDDTLKFDCTDFFCDKPQGLFNYQIAESMFVNRNKVDSLWLDIYNIKPYKSTKYRYSDVNFNLLQKVVEAITNQSLDEYVYNTFYNPLNMRHCQYNPLHQFEKEDIAPTEFDTKWRMQQLQGYVHDESAAILGGVGGNAGLFSNAKDMATLFQMLLNGGSYGDKQYLLPSTIETFTSKQRHSYRGLGFDKPRSTKYPSYSKRASTSTYGHTGFTGPCVWIDPSKELVFIFLTNRIYPDVDNKKLFKDKVRYRIHNVIYDAFDSFELALPNLEKSGLKHQSQRQKFSKKTCISLENKSRRIALNPYMQFLKKN